MLGLLVSSAGNGPLLVPLPWVRVPTGLLDADLGLEPWGRLQAQQEVPWGKANAESITMLGFVLIGNAARGVPAGEWRAWDSARQ